MASVTLSYHCDTRIAGQVRLIKHEHSLRSGEPLHQPAEHTVKGARCGYFETFTDRKVVSAAAAVAFARAGQLQDEEAMARVFELLSVASSRKNALRTILQSGAALDTNRLVAITALAEDPDTPLGTKKLASAILATHQGPTSTADQGE